MSTRREFLALGAAAALAVGGKPRKHRIARSIDDEVGLVARTTSVVIGTDSGGGPTTTQTRFGAWTGFDQNGVAETYDARVARVTALFGGRLASQRYFQLGGFTNWPQYYGNNLECLLSITQDPIAVANGNFDTQILAWLRDLPFGQGAPTFDVCLNHEADLSVPVGANQVAGWRHFSDLVLQVKSEGHTNLRRTPIFTNYTISVIGTDAWLPWYAGDAYCDAIGWDCYRNSDSRNTVLGCFQPPYQKCLDHGKPFIVGETSIKQPFNNGTTITEAQWTQWTTDTIAYLSGKADSVMWFESNKADGDWRLAAHPASADLWKQAVINSWL